ncbi:MAG: hypothetical protein ABFC84_17990 [Veillonellales bacterium]
MNNKKARDYYPGKRTAVYAVVSTVELIRLDNTVDTVLLGEALSKEQPVC